MFELDKACSSLTSQSGASNLRTSHRRDAISYPPSDFRPARPSRSGAHRPPRPPDTPHRSMLVHRPSAAISYRAPRAKRASALGVPRRRACPSDQPSCSLPCRARARCRPSPPACRSSHSAPVSAAPTVVGTVVARLHHLRGAQQSSSSPSQARPGSPPPGSSPDGPSRSTTGPRSPSS